MGGEFSKEQQCHKYCSKCLRNNPKSTEIPMFLNAINHVHNGVSYWVEVRYKCSNGHLFYVISNESHYNLCRDNYTTNSIEYKQQQEIIALKEEIFKLNTNVVTAEVVTEK